MLRVAPDVRTPALQKGGCLAGGDDDRWPSTQRGLRGLGFVRLSAGLRITLNPKPSTRNC